jgi:DNA translocase FtsK/SpoIIIE-like protein
VSHTFSPDAVRRADTLAVASLVAAAIAAVIVFWPPEGRVLAPVHEIIQALLGRAGFLLPLSFVLVGALGFARRARPDLKLPTRRLAGVAIIALAVLPAERLLGDSTGLIGDWLTSFLLALFGGPLTIVAIVMLVGVGAVLAFDFNVRKLADRAAR